MLMVLTFYIVHSPLLVPLFWKTRGLENFRPLGIGENPAIYEVAVIKMEKMWKERTRGINEGTVFVVINFSFHMIVKLNES